MGDSDLSLATRQSQWLTEVDGEILRMCALMSPKQIATEIESKRNKFDDAQVFEPTPEYVIQRTRQMLDDTKWLAQMELEQHLLLRMYKLLDALETDFYRIAQGAGVASLEHAKVQIATLKMISGQLESRRKINEDELSVFDENVGREILRTVDRALSHMRGALTGAGGIAEDEWDDALESAMLYAAQPILEKAPALKLPGAKEEPSAVAEALKTFKAAEVPATPALAPPTPAPAPEDGDSEELVW